MLSRAALSHNALNTSSRLTVPSFLPSLPAPTRPYARRYATPSTEPNIDPRFPPEPRQPLVREPNPPNPTSEFYRNLIPSMLHCLALGSIVYYALECGYMYLSREKQAEDMGKRVEQLERELAVARAGPAVAGSDRVQSSGQSWCKFW